VERQRVDLAETAEDEASTLSKAVAQTIRAVLRLRIQKTLKLRPALRKVLFLTLDRRVVRLGHRFTFDSHTAFVLLSG